MNCVIISLGDSADPKTLLPQSCLVQLCGNVSGFDEVEGTTYILVEKQIKHF